ncbi:MAG: PAS domain S-box protein [Sphingobacteriales bacterium]|nr:MAG: PAS domain S-box protein [Sphingobacteriales bacterium]
MIPYSQAFLDMPFPCWIYNPETLAFLAVNESAIRQYGFAYEEFVGGLTILDVRPAEDREMIRMAVSSLASKPNQAGIWRHMKKNGEVFYVRIFSCPVTLNGEDCRFVAAINVNEQVKVERSTRKLHFMIAKQKEQLESILSGLKEVVWAVRPDDLRFKYISPACKDLYGYSSEELLKDSELLMSRIHPEDQPMIPQLREDLLRQKTITTELRFIHKDGSIKHVWHECHAEFTSSGKAYKITGASIDVTEQRIAQIALENQSKMMQEIYESISDVFFVLDKEMNFAYLNKVFEQTYNVTRESLLGKNIWDHFKAARSYKYAEQFTKAYTTQTTVEFEEYAPSIDRWLFVKAYPFSEGLAIYFRNITREKQLREQVKKDTQNMRALIDNTEDLIWSVDKELRLLSFNQAYRNWYTTARSGSPRVGDIELVEELGSASYWKWHQYYQKALSGFAFKVEEEELVEDGVRYFECSFKPIRDRDGSIWGVSCFSKDITDYKAQIEEIEVRNKKLKEIAWLQSHKVRSPVATILGLTQLINKDDFTDPENQVLIEHIETAAVTLDEVIHAIVEHTSELRTEHPQEVPVHDPEKEYTQGTWDFELLKQALPVPENEAARIQDLLSYGILDSVSDKSFDDITLLAAAMCGKPRAMISFVDEKRSWFLPQAGFHITETPRQLAFSSYAIMDAEKVFVVNDTLEDPRFSANPLVQQVPAIRFYAGAPVVSNQGFVLGSLCVIDQVPGTITGTQEEQLRMLAGQVAALLELRKLRNTAKKFRKNKMAR